MALNFLLGAYFIYKVPKEAFPSVSMNQIVIVTKYPGASAKDVELNVTSKIEDRIAEVGNIKEYRSSSIEGVSRITIFADEDLNDLQFRALLGDVEAEVDKVDDFPSDIEGEPVINTVTTEDRPILEIAYQGSYDQLKKFLPKTEKELRQISGVSNVSAVGLPEEEIHIEVDAQKALERDVDLNSIYHAIDSRNQVGTGGTLESFIGQKKVVSFNKYANAEDVLNTVIRMSPDGQGVYLSDVADIRYRAENDKLLVRNNGERGATLLIAIRSGVDQLKVSDRVKEFLESQKLPPGVDYTLNNDVSDNARSKFSLLKNNGIIGFSLVVILLFFFLGGKPAFWTAFGIPFTVFGSMLLIVPLGLTLNSVSMGAFVIILGMIVDDAMVISERFDSNREKGEGPEQAAGNAVAGLWKPVLASSLTTITAFMPLLSLGGLPGKFIWQMPTVVMIALFVSLIDCYFLLPAHLAHSQTKASSYKKNGLVLAWERLYEKVLFSFIRYRYLVIAGFLLIFVGSAYIGATKIPKNSFPQEAAEGFMIKATLEKGFSEEKVEKKIAKIEESIESLKETELVGHTTRIGTHSTSSLTELGTEENLVTFLVYLTPYSDRERTASEIVQEIKSKNLEDYENQGYDLEFDLMRIGPPLGEPFEIIVSSNQDDRRKKASESVKDFVGGINGVYDVKDDNIPGKDEINLELDYKKVAQAGLSPSQIIRTLRIAFDGQIVTDFNSVNQSYDYRLRLNEQTRGDFDFISELPIANNRGQLIHLNRMVNYENRPSSVEIKHYDGVRSTSITGNIESSKITALDMFKRFQNDFEKRENVKYTLSGRPVEEKEIFAGLQSAALLAIVGIYFILSLIFDSYFKPFLILLVIPFGVVGVFISYYFHQLPISMFTGIGLIGLSGIVVNDSIVLVDHISKKIKDNGEFTRELLVEGAKDRLRPISLTTISTVFAVAPTAYAIGGYDPLLSPLSLAILYGLLFATTVVLLFLPSLYVVGKDIGHIFKKVRHSRGLGLFLIFGFLSFTGNLTTDVAEASEKKSIDVKEILSSLESSDEYKIQDESVNQAKFSYLSVDGMLDGQLETEIFTYDSERYSNPPISLDSQRSGKGISLNYDKLTPYGFKFGVGVAVEEERLNTVPRKQEFFLDATNTTYEANLGVPLWRNLGTRLYHLQKSNMELQKKATRYKSDAEKDKLLVKALTSYWQIMKLKVELEVAQKSLERFLKLHELNKKKRRSGIISKAELLTSEIEVTSRRRRVGDIQGMIDVEKIQLKSVLELDDIDLTVLHSEMKGEETLGSLSLGQMKNIIETGRSLNLVEVNKKIASRAFELEKEDEKSDLDFVVSAKSLGRDRDVSGAFRENVGEKYEVYAGLTWKFDTSRAKSSNDIAKALSRKRQSFLQQSRVREKLFDALEEVRREIQANKQQVRYLHTIRDKQRETIKAEKKRFRNGKITTLDYVKHQEAYDGTLLNIIALKYVNELRALNLFEAIGEMEHYLQSYREG